MVVVVGWLLIIHKVIVRDRLNAMPKRPKVKSSSLRGKKMCTRMREKNHLARVTRNILSPQEISYLQREYLGAICKRNAILVREEEKKEREKKEREHIPVLQLHRISENIFTTNIYKVIENYIK